MMMIFWVCSPGCRSSPAFCNARLIGVQPVGSQALACRRSKFLSTLCIGTSSSVLWQLSAFERNRVVTPDRFLPLLDRVAKNDSYLHMARERAAALADAIRNPKPKAVE